MTDITQGLTLVDDIDTAEVAPSWESTSGVSSVTDVLGKKARVMVPVDTPVAMSYVIGKDKGLKANGAYVLVVEYPDDVPRSTFMINRGSDYLRGWATGTAFGDSRSQFTEPSNESLNYPQSGEWQSFKQVFFLFNRFQGVVGTRSAKAGCRPFVPADGFNVVIFQVKKMDDPRSEGAAIGHIKLYEVPDYKALVAPVHYPPEDMPKRRVFFREEMSNGFLMTNNPEDQAFTESSDWYVNQIRMSKILAINTFTMHLLVFGFNQGWDSGDQNWVMNAQPPNKDLWGRLVPRIAEEGGMDVLPYFEYKGAIGLENSLAKQRRAHKLYDGIKEVGGNKTNYTPVYWAEPHDGDLTDPDLIADAEKMLDKTITQYKGQVKFAGVWFRTRNTHLPISFSDATITRFKSDLSSDEQAQTASQETLIASYEGDKALYNKYITWWFGKRAEFLTTIRDYLNTGLDQKDTQVLFTTWPTETVPVLYPKDKPFTHAGVVTDDPAWWKSYANGLNDAWYKWHLMPTPFENAGKGGLYADVLKGRQPINSSSGDAEWFHSAPGDDPEDYKKIDNVMLTFPMGRLFTVQDPALLDEYRSATGLTVARFYPLNEDADDPNAKPTPFGHLLGYVCVDSDRAGNYMMLQPALAVANGDPRNIAYLSGSSFSCGYPEIMRRFNQAFLAVPALPSKRLDDASNDPEVVVREISTEGKGTYYYVVNTGMEKKTGVAVKLPGKGAVTNLVTNTAEKGTELTLNLDPAELQSYRVGP